MPRIVVLWIKLSSGGDPALDRQFKVLHACGKTLDEDGRELGGHTLQMNLNRGKRGVGVDRLEDIFCEMVSPVLAREVINREGA